MKKTLTALAIFASIFAANAQKSADVAKAAAAMQKAYEATLNPKKAEKPATWIDYADKCSKAYSAPFGNGYTNASRTELQIVMNGVKPSSEETLALSGQEYLVEHYETADYYYQNGVLRMIVPTQTADPEALDKSLEAYAHAAKVDPKGTKTKDIKTAIGFIVNKYAEDGMAQYVLGNPAQASILFEKGYNASRTEPYDHIDSSAVYNAGFCAFDAGQYERCITMMQESVRIQHLEDGAVYSKMAESYKNLGDTTSMVKTLEEGFSMCPSSQGILIGLINYYIDSKSDTGRLFSLLDAAKANEPENASLYYVEGNIHKQLGNIESAVASYDKCAEVNPAYEFGYIGKGLMYYDEAIKVADEAQNEFNEAKYMALVEKYEGFMKNAAEPFEKAFETTNDNSIKRSVAEYLKNIYYRFRDADAAYMEAYTKYNEYIKNN